MRIAARFHIAYPTGHEQVPQVVVCRAGYRMSMRIKRTWLGHILTSTSVEELSRVAWEVATPLNR